MKSKKEPTNVVVVVFLGVFVVIMAGTHQSTVSPNLFRNEEEGLFVAGSISINQRLMFQ